MGKSEFCNKHNLYPLLHHVEHLLDVRTLELIEGNKMCYEIDYPIFPNVLYMNKCEVRGMINARLEEIYEKEVRHGKTEHEKTTETVSGYRETTKGNIIPFPCSA